MARETKQCPGSHVPCPPTQPSVPSSREDDDQVWAALRCPGRDRRSGPMGTGFPGTGECRSLLGGRTASRQTEDAGSAGPALKTGQRRGCRDTMQTPPRERPPEAERGCCGHPLKVGRMALNTCVRRVHTLTHHPAPLLRLSGDRRKCQVAPCSFPSVASRLSVSKLDCVSYRKNRRSWWVTHPSLCKRALGALSRIV